jgi:ATP adenylyltransferase C-terminal domain
MRQTDCPVPLSTATTTTTTSSNKSLSSKKVGIKRSRQLFSADDPSRSDRNALRVRESQAREEQVQRDQELELPFCDAYNLVLTEQWMMVVPRTNGKFEELITVNGLGKILAQ